MTLRGGTRVGAEKDRPVALLATAFTETPPALPGGAGSRGTSADARHGARLAINAEGISFDTERHHACHGGILP